MALVLADRVQELTTTSGTGTLTLNGAVPGFQGFFTGIGSGNTTYYTIYDPTTYDWEVGIGTFTRSGTDTLSRDTVLSNSLGTTAKISLAGNQTNVFVTYPSSKSVYEDSSGNVSPLGIISSGTWQGSTIAVAYGGTGVTASSGANSVVLRDANQNITVNRLNQGLQTTTASGGTTVLTVASQFNQALVGTGGHTFRLPDATTLSNTTAFQFNNNATGTLTIIDNASGVVGTVAPGGAAGIALLSNATIAGTWDVHAYIPENVTWGTNALALGSTVISGGTWQGGTITPAYGGTGLTSFSAANNALYSTGATTLTAGTLPIAAGGTGQTTANAALNALLPSQATNSGKYLTTDGTNSSWATVTQTTFSAGTTGFTPSTPTSGAVTLAGTLITSNGGTGQSTYTAGDLLYYASGTALTKLGIGTNGQILTSTGSAPQWTTLSGVAVTSINFGTTGLTPATATSGAVSVAGTLNAANGGTGQSSYTVGDILYASTTTALSKLADVATGNALISGGVGVAPSWGKIGLTTHVSGTLGVGNGGTGQTTYTDGQLLIGNTTGNTLTKATLTQGSGITITNGSGAITIANASPMTYPGAGIPNSTGSAWGTSYSTSGTGTTVALTGNPTFASLTNSGNITFTGTGNRITGDFSNATVTNRVAFQTSTTNGNTGVYFLPNGTSTTCSIQTFNTADPTNSAMGIFGAVSTDIRIQSGITGTGTYLPMTFFTGGSERMRINTSGAVIIGNGETSTNPASGILEATDGSGTNVIGASLTIQGGRGTGTAPGGSLLFATAPGGTTGSALNAAQTRMTIDATGNVTVAQASRGTITTDNDLSFDMNAASNFSCTPTAGGTLTFTNITAGQSGYILLVNNSNYVITAAATTKVGVSFLSTISTTGTYLISYFSNGTNVFCTTSGALS
jgi:hypothetical protein